uniref:Cellulose synthase n=1 Tax=Rhizophora mucronata TaxID=61149 RepID=A0A2P2IIF7_RHIMU
MWHQLLDQFANLLFLIGPSLLLFYPLVHNKKLRY